jgi:hypothetical protein
MSAAPSGSTIPVTIEMLWRSEAAIAGLHAFVSEVEKAVAEISKSSATIPIRADNQIAKEITAITDSLRRDQIKLPVTIDEAAIQSAMTNLRTQLATQSPLQVPVQFAPSGTPNSAGSAEEAASAAADAGATARPRTTGFGRPLQTLFLAHMALRAVGNDIELEGGNPLQQPDQQLQQMKAHVQSLGVIEPIARFLGQHSAYFPGTPQEKMDALTGAERAERAANTNIHRMAAASATRIRATDTADALAAADSESGATAVERQRAAIQKTLKSTFDAADKLLDGIKEGTGMYVDISASITKIKSHAQSIADKALAEIVTESEEALQGLNAQGKQLDLTLSGDAAGARKQAREVAILKTTAELRKRNPFLADYFTENVAPKLRDLAAHQEDIRAAAIANQAANVTAAAGQRGAGADLSAAGQHDLAALNAANFAIDHRLEVLKQEIAVTDDLVKKDALRAQYDAESAAAVKEKAANQERYDRSRADLTRAITERGSEQLLRNDRSEKLADVLGLAENVRSELYDTRGNPDAQLAVRRLGIAQLEAIRKGSRGIASIGSDEEAYKTFQVNALKAGKDQGADDFIRSLEKVLGDGGSFDGAIKDFSEGAKVLKNVKVVGVIRDY